MSFNYPSDAMEQETLERVAQRYRDEGYQVVVRPAAEQIPPFIADFEPDLIAIRGNESVIVEIKVNRMDLSSDHQISHLAEIVNSRPGWRLDLVVLEPETTVERAGKKLLSLPTTSSLRSCKPPTNCQRKVTGLTLVSLRGAVWKRPCDDCGVTRTCMDERRRLN